QTEALKNAERLVHAIEAGDQDTSTLYSAACSFALAGRSDDAFCYLNRAIQGGFGNVDQIRSDADLTSLRTDSRWQAVLARAEERHDQQQSASWNKPGFWDSPIMSTPYKDDLTEDEKIAGLSKLWSEVKYGFANFDLVPDLDWDATY